MKELKITITIFVDDDGVDNIKKWEHHIDYAIDTNEYPEIKQISNVKVTEVGSKEPATLGEIANVTFEYGRLVLRVNDPIAARKFGLSDSTYRYEFDGYSLFWYKSKDENSSCSWKCDCGRNGYALVTSDTERQIKAVKQEMRRQVISNLFEKYKNNPVFKDVVIDFDGIGYDGFGNIKLYEDA